MAPLPPLTPPPPEKSGTRVAARTRSAAGGESPNTAGSAEIVLSKLRDMIAGGRQDLETILGTIAVAAQALTGAGGAAMAMPRDGAVVCVGRSGDIAPELGNRINLNSGISGECLHTGRIMRCDDAERDFHVDSEVCRQMGVQSIAVVPLRGQHGRVGLLEAFSAHSYAFSDEHMELLGRLAGLAEVAWARAHATPGLEAQETEGNRQNQHPQVQDLQKQGSQRQVLPDRTLRAHDLPTHGAGIERPRSGNSQAARTTPTKVSAEPPRRATASVVQGRAAQALAAELHADLQSERRLRYAIIAILAAIFLVLLTIFAWKAWYKASLPVSSMRPAPTPQEVAPETTDATVAAGSGSTPGKEHKVSGSKPALPARVPASTAAVDPPDTLIRLQPAPEVTDANVASTATVSDSGAADAPAIPVSSGELTEVEGLLSASPALPKLGGPVSEGVAGGALIHKVLPVYPSEARRAHVQGMVILEGMVTEVGRIENLRLVDGPPLLAKAAIDAVSQWRYTPYLLNGKPIRKLARVNINFIAQQ